MERTQGVKGKSSGAYSGERGCGDPSQGGRPEEAGDGLSPEVRKAAYHLLPCLEIQPPLDLQNLVVICYCSSKKLIQRLGGKLITQLQRTAMKCLIRCVRCVTMESHKAVQKNKDGVASWSAF